MEKGEYLVVRPTSSGDVEELAARMMYETGTIKLVIRSFVESGDTDQEITMTINEHSGPLTGPRLLGGRVLGENFYAHVSISGNPDAPAVLSMTQLE